MHVNALSPKVPSGTYIANSGGDAGTVWQTATEIVAKNFPQAVAKGFLANNGVEDTRRGRIDATRSEEVFGFKFLGFEEQVKSVVAHYLELIGEVAA